MFSFSMGAFQMDREANPATNKQINGPRIVHKRKEDFEKS